MPRALIAPARRWLAALLARGAAPDPPPGLAEAVVAEVEAIGNAAALAAAAACATAGGAAAR